MKTQIINLEPFDDIVSARDKLGWAKADRVIVVWPVQGRILTRRLDLILLRRQAHAMGARLGIVSHDHVVRQFAVELHIPLFDSMDEAHNPSWPVALPGADEHQQSTPQIDLDRDHIKQVRRRRLRPPSLLSRMVAIQGIVIASILLLATFLPWAQIELDPETYSSSQVVILQLEPELEMPQEGVISATQVSLVLSGSLRMPTSGQVDFPSARATGYVVFTNLGDQAITIAAGTGLRVEQDGELRFVTLEPVNLPGRENSRVEASIEAALPGADGNLPADAIRAVEGPLGLQVEVTNPEPTAGGADETRAGVAASDLPAARRRLLEDLTELASLQIEADLEDGQALSLGSLQVDQVLSQEYDRQAGQAGDTILVSMRVQFTAWVYSPGEVEAAVRPLVAESRPEDAQPVPGTLQVEEEMDTPLRWEEDRLYFRVEEQIYYGPSPDQLLRLLWFVPAGRAADELSHPLQRYPQGRRHAAACRVEQT